MNSGTVKLLSGAWDWLAYPQQSGTTIVFEHRGRPHDRMRAWAALPPQSEDEVRELALDPLERTWADADGIRWTLRISHQRLAAGGEEDLLNFEYRGMHKRTLMPPGIRLGNLSHLEIGQLFSSAP